MLNITPKAAERIATVVDAHEEYAGLRVGLKDAGCSGYMYTIDFVSGPEEADATLEEGVARVFVPTGQSDQLSGSTLDWLDGVFESGFRIANPRAKSVCGCGESFDLQEQGGAR